MNENQNAQYFIKNAERFCFNENLHFIIFSQSQILLNSNLKNLFQDYKHV
jgi:hypothetical protein